MIWFSFNKAIIWKQLPGNSWSDPAPRCHGGVWPSACLRSHDSDRILHDHPQNTLSLQDSHLLDEERAGRTQDAH